MKVDSEKCSFLEKKTIITLGQVQAMSSDAQRKRGAWQQQKLLCFLFVFAVGRELLSNLILP